MAAAEGSYTKEEIGALLQEIEPRVSIALLILGSISLCVFFMFKSQRKFPTCILAWLVIFNVINDIWLVIKWTNMDVSASLTTNLHLCNLSIFLDMHHQSNSVTINTLMTICLFVLLRLHRDMDYDVNPYYLWVYVAVVAIVPTTIALIVTLAGPPEAEYNCVSRVPIVLVYTVAVALMICVQLVLLILVSAEVWRVVNAVKNTTHSKGDIRLMYITTRFSLSVIAQIIQISGLYVYFLRPSLAKNLLNSVVWTSPIGEFIDLLVLFFGNQHMWKWIAGRRYRNMVSLENTSPSTIESI